MFWFRVSANLFDQHQSISSRLSLWLQIAMQHMNTHVQKSKLANTSLFFQCLHLSLTPSLDQQVDVGCCLGFTVAFSPCIGFFLIHRQSGFFWLQSFVMCLHAALKFKLGLTHASLVPGMVAVLFGTVDPKLNQSIQVYKIYGKSSAQTKARRTCQTPWRSFSSQHQETSHEVLQHPRHWPLPSTRKADTSKWLIGQLQSTA